MATYTVGQKIEYWSETHSQWIQTTVVEVKDVRGQQMLCIKHKPAACIPIDSTSVRPSQQEQQSEANDQAVPDGPPVSLGPPALTGGRERGFYNDEAKKLSASLLAVHGSVLGIFDSWATTYAKESERKELKDKILQVFSKEPMSGVSYVKFSSPGAKVGQAHPSMLNFVPAVFDLYTPYTIDFQRELDDLWTYGFNDTLKLTVFSPSPSQTNDACWSDFAYGPDGAYMDFVRYSVILFVVITTSSGLLSLPDDWLRDDLRGLQAVCQASGNLERSLSSLKDSMRQSKTARVPDPLMLDNMLAQQNLTGASKAKDFVNKYNQMVFYDKSLMLENHTATRQCELMRPERINSQRKQLLRKRIDTSESFADSGLTLTMMDMKEFWDSSKLTPSTNPMWISFASTTCHSNFMAIEHYFKWIDSNNAPEAKVYKTYSRRAVVARSLSTGSFKRLGIGSTVCDRMVALIMAGRYDNDVESLMEDCEDIEVDHMQDFDHYLLQNYNVAQDALEFQQGKSDAAESAEADAAETDAVVISDEDFVISQISLELQKVMQATHASEEKKSQLKEEEARYECEARTNAFNATKGFLQTRVQFVAKHVSDKTKFEFELAGWVQNRVSEVAKHANCPEANVQIHFFYDLAADGAMSVSAVEEVSKWANIVTGSGGMATIMATEIPSHKGRARTTQKRKHVSVDTGASPDLPSADGAVAVAGLPAAPSEMDISKDSGELMKLLRDDFVKLMNIDCCQGRFSDTKIFDVKGGNAARCVVILPVNKSPWQKTKLVEEGILHTEAGPTSFVDIGIHAATLARTQEIQTYPSKNKLSGKALRSQRGAQFFKGMYDDLARAAQALKDATQKRSVILHVNVRSWVGDDAAALVDWTVSNMKTDPDGPMVYGLFHDMKESNALVSKARAAARARQLYEQGVLVCPGFSPVPVPESLKKMRGEVAGARPSEYGFVKVCEQDGVWYPVVQCPKPLSYPIIAYSAGFWLPGWPIDLFQG